MVMMFVGMVVVRDDVRGGRGLHDGDARGRELHGHDDDRGHAHGRLFFGIGLGYGLIQTLIAHFHINDQRQRGTRPC